MTTQNAGEKEQGMSEVYKAEQDSIGFWMVRGPSFECSGVDGKRAHTMAANMNLAHAHATAAAARRVRELEEALNQILAITRDDENYEQTSATKDIAAEVVQALAGKERSDGAE